MQTQFKLIYKHDEVLSVNKSKPCLFPFEKTKLLPLQTRANTTLASDYAPAAVYLKLRIVVRCISPQALALGIGRFKKINKQYVSVRLKSAPAQSASIAVIFYPLNCFLTQKCQTKIFL